MILLPGCRGEVSKIFSDGFWLCLALYLNLLDLGTPHIYMYHIIIDIILNHWTGLYCTISSIGIIRVRGYDEDLFLSFFLPFGYVS